jgi:hypothetical protein
MTEIKANYRSFISEKYGFETDFYFSFFSEFHRYLIPFFSTAYIFEQYKRFKITEEF